MAYIKDVEEFDPQTLRILGEALDDAWQRVKRNHLNGRAYAARSVLAQHIYAMAKQGERDPRHLIDGALMRAQTLKLSRSRRTKRFHAPAFGVR